MSDILYIKEFAIGSTAGGTDAVGLAICSENRFRPPNCEIPYIKGALSLLFKGATGIDVEERFSTEFYHAAFKPLAWGIVSQKDAENHKRVLKEAVKGLNALINYN